VGGLLSLDDAVAAVLEHVGALGAEDVRTADALGRVCADDVRAAVDLPPFPSSAMDGFAVRSADVPGTLPVGFRIAAGRPAEAALAPGEAMGIATGGTVPDGADAVVPVEDVVERANTIEIARPVPPGAHVRPRGGDVRAGDVVVPRGTRLGPAQLGALAAAGVAALRCARRPRVALLTTGTELRAPGEPLGPGQIYESNGTMLAASLGAAGAIVESLPPVPDDEAAHREALERALEADVVVTSGGVSVGPHDLVRAIGRELGVREVFWGVAVKPGKPVAFGVRAATLVFGLPGNPVSSLVSAELFVVPAVLALQGAARPGPRWQPGALAGSLRRNAARDELVRARVLEDGTLEPVGGQESHMIVRAAAADALVLVPRGEGVLQPGTAVRWLRPTGSP
jgi:molybdopterin molybdotransferase